ncbi:VGLU1 protein, partial [Calonectris borealis]|nr:VGLU1 protein [Calonectris borealis]
RALERRQEDAEGLELGPGGGSSGAPPHPPVLDCTCCGLPRRYGIAVLCAIGFCISFGIRCNLGVAVVSMVNGAHGQVRGAGGHGQVWGDWGDWAALGGMGGTGRSGGTREDGQPGGPLAGPPPPPRVFGLAIVSTSLLNMLIPAAARTHVGCVITVRVLQGLVE